MATLTMDRRNVEARGGTMRDVLSQAATLLGPGRAFDRVVVDGVERVGYMEESFLSMPIGSIGRVEIETQPLRGLVLKGLELERNFMTEVAGGLPNIARAFRASEMPKASESLIIVGEGLRSLVLVLQGMSVFYPELFKSFTHDGKSIDAHLHSFSRTLESIQAAQARSDWPQLADVLEHEMSATITTWVALLEALMSRLHKQEDGAS